MRCSRMLDTSAVDGPPEAERQSLACHQPQENKMAVARFGTEVLGSIYLARLYCSTYHLRICWSALPVVVRLLWTAG